MAESSSEGQQPKDKTNDKPYVILALQGGGALGAFQVGAYKALHEKGYEPDWVAGISIGAINASIIAGNPNVPGDKEKNRLDRLLKFWSMVAGNLDWWERLPNYSEKLTNLWRVWLSMAGGVSGFFNPNSIPGPFANPNSPEASSMYNVQSLKKTLRTLVNFDFLNETIPVDENTKELDAKNVRLSLGVTRVFGGVPTTFQNFDGPNDDPDDKRRAISTDHIMASGALAPWFPGISIPDLAGESGEAPKRLYWDGGITSNSSFKNIIADLPKLYKRTKERPILIFVIDLWGAFDREPKTFDEVCWRIKQTQYSSRIEQDINYAKEYLYSARQKLAPSNDPTWDPPRIDIIRVSYLSHPNEIPCGDALFSRTEIERRTSDGYAAMSHRLEMKPCLWKLDADLGDHRRPKENKNVVVHLF